jgi:hypothetical protein
MTYGHRPPHPRCPRVGENIMSGFHLVHSADTYLNEGDLDVVLDMRAYLSRTSRMMKSLSSPLNSTPVGPPPTTTQCRSRFFSLSGKPSDNAQYHHH